MVWSADRFDRRLAVLFEELEGREAELQGRLDDLVRGLVDGSVSRARQHHPTDDTCCLPLIDRLVVVFRPNVSEPSLLQNLIYFPSATRVDLLTIEEESA